MQTLAIGEDNLIEVGTADDPLKLASNGNTVSDATITAQLKSEDLATNIGSQITVSATATAGVYQGTLPSSVALTQDTFYWLEITITGTATGFRRIKCQGQYHGEEP